VNLIIPYLFLIAINNVLKFDNLSMVLFFLERKYVAAAILIGVHILGMVYSLCVVAKSRIRFFLWMGIMCLVWKYDAPTGSATVDFPLAQSVEQRHTIFNWRSQVLNPKEAKL
jgi:hypothetical protein